MAARKAPQPTRMSQAEKISRTLLSVEELAALQADVDSARGVKKAWKSSLLKRQYSRRATVERLTKTSTDGFDREVADLDARGFEGVAGGRMSTVMPPVNTASLGAMS